MTQMLDLNDLRYFSLVAEHGGFSAVERLVHVSKSRLSRRISALEDQLGARLFQRSTRRLSLTEAGRALQSHAAAMLVEADAAQQAVAQLRAEPVGTVRLTCPVVMSQYHLAPLLARFMRQHPKVRIELDTTDRLVNLIDERIDIALRVRSAQQLEPGFVARRLATARMVLVASPRLLGRRRPSRPDQLSGMPTIAALRGGPEQNWSLVSSSGEPVQIAHRPRLLCTDFAVQQQAALEGVGIALLPLRVVAPALTDGTLRRVLPDWSTPPEDIHALVPTRRGMLPSVRVLLDFLAAELPAILAIPDSLL